MTTHSDPGITISLDDPMALDSSVVGEKAASLARLRQAGLPVPQGFVIRASVFAGATKEWESDFNLLFHRVDEEPTALGRVSAELRKLVAGLTYTASLRKAVSVRYREMGYKMTVAVRSSGTAEDLPGASFAGQYDSVLNIRGVDGILAQMRFVWASNYSERAIAYRQQHNIPHFKSGMAVLIQAQLASDASGVLFTCDPISGDSGRMTINAALGLGEGLVSGKVRSDTFVLDSDSLAVIDSTIATKSKMIDGLPGGGIAEKLVSQKLQKLPALNDAQLTRLGQLALKVKQLEGGHRDIEFACVNGDIHLLQSRPVTGIADASDDLESAEVQIEFPVIWEDPEDEESLWHLRYGSSPEPEMKLNEELQRSMAVHQQRVFEDTGVPMASAYDIRVFNGYIYFRPPRASKDEITERIDRHREVGKTYSDRGANYYVEVIEPQVLSIYRGLGSFHRPASESLTSRIDFLERAMEANARVMGDLHWRMTGGGGYEEWAEVYHELTGRPQVEAGVLLQGIDNRTMQMVRRLRKLARVVQSDQALQKIFETGHYRSLSNPELLSRPAIKLFNRRFGTLLQIFGRRTGYSYGSSTPRGTPTWNLDHTIPLDIIATYAGRDLDELDRLEQRARRERINATRRTRRAVKNDSDRRRLEQSLNNAKQQIRNMENHNYLMEQGVSGVLNEAIWWVGKQLAETGRTERLGDNTYLDLQDLRAAATHDGDLRPLIRERKEEFDRRSRMKPPRTLGKGELPQRSQRGEEKQDQDRTADALELKGVAASRGRHTGPARVFLTPGEMPEVKHGDILVARDAGQDWAPVMPLLGGIVLDEGVLFQHAALIAREYGIPCVIQTRRSTKVISEGQRITVDGSEGVVELAESNHTDKV